MVASWKVRQGAAAPGWVYGEQGRGWGGEGVGEGMSSLDLLLSPVSAEVLLSQPQWTMNAMATFDNSHFWGLPVLTLRVADQGHWFWRHLSLAESEGSAGICEQTPGISLSPLQSPGYPLPSQHNREFRVLDAGN